MNAAQSNLTNASSLAAELVRRIVSAGRPQEIVLFGSEIRNEARPDSDLDILPDSDLDILIVERESFLPRHQRATAYRATLLDLALKLNRDIEVLVYTADEINEWPDVPNAFVTTALREGQILYERSGGFRSNN